jgi:predicted RNase H-like HicB family nuclease
MKYRIALHTSDEGYSVSVPGLPGCWSRGDTEAEALDNIKDAIREYLAVANDDLKDADIREVEGAESFGCQVEGEVRGAAQSIDCLLDGDEQLEGSEFSSGCEYRWNDLEVLSDQRTAQPTSQGRPTSDGRVERDSSRVTLHRAWLSH